MGGEIDEPDRPPALRQRRDEVGDVFGQRVREADDAVGGEARQNLAGEGLGDRPDAEERLTVRLCVGIFGAAAGAVDRGPAVLDDADDEGRDLCRQEQDLPGKADRLVERGLSGARDERPRQSRAGEEGEDVASAHGGLRSSPE